MKTSIVALLAVALAGCASVEEFVDQHPRTAVMATAVGEAVLLGVIYDHGPDHRRMVRIPAQPGPEAAK